MKKRLLSLTLVLSLALTGFTPVSMYGAGLEENVEEIVMLNPLYAESRSEEEKTALVAALNELSVGNTIQNTTLVSTHNTKVYENLAEAADYISEKMVAREELIEIVVANALVKDSVLTPFLEAMEYTEDCTGQEGDALFANYDGVSVTYSVGASVTTIRYYVIYMTTAEQEAELTKAVNAALKEMNLNGKSDYQKVRLIHDYICNHVDYDFEHYNSTEVYIPMYTAYAAMCDGVAVCQGYAALFYRMCKDAGLSVRFVTGFAGQRHAWNIVRIGNEYYNIDTTWDGQDAETYYNYFLKSQEDFEDHWRDEEYDTSEFHKAFPMALHSWEDYSKLVALEGLDLENLSLRGYSNIEGGTISNHADGKPKVLVFGRVGCPNTQSTISSLSKENFEGVDVVYVDMDRNSQAAVKDFRDTYGNANDDLLYTYSTAGTNFWSYVEYLTGNVNTITLPYIVYIDADNRIQYKENAGYFSGASVQQKINVYCKGATLISISKSTLSLKAGEYKDLEVAVYGSTRNSQFFTWSSSNPKVATVDANGTVKAISTGDAVITCKASDKVYVTSKITVTGSINGLHKAEDGVWYYYKNGVVDKTYTGMAKNDYGWWYVKNGKLDKTYTGMAKNEYGWWYMKKGKLDKTYTGMAKNEYGWWYLQNGTINFKYTGMAKNDYGWWYMKSGKLDKTYTGMAKNDYGWWYMKNGKLDKTYTGMAKNQYGWFYMKNGKLDTTFEGIAQNDWGKWYMKKGQLQSNFSGTKTFNGITYTIKNGKVVE